MNISIRTRLFSLATAFVMTFATLASIDSLATSDMPHGELARAAQAASQSA